MGWKVGSRAGRDYSRFAVAWTLPGYFTSTSALSNPLQQILETKTFCLRKLIFAVAILRQHPKFSIAVDKEAYL